MLIKQLDKHSIRLPAVGQGMGDDFWDDSNIESIHKGIDLGMNFIDTAEIYAKGLSEEILGKTIKDIRENVIIGTKFSPEHNSYEDVIKSADKSLHRLRTDYIDLYQVHWTNPLISIKETMSAMENLVEEGKIKYIGVCNHSLKELKEAQSSLTHEKISTLQLEYNLIDRTIEKDIIPYCIKNKIIVISYSPLDRGRVSDSVTKRKLLHNLATKYNKTISQINLRWLTSKLPVVAIPKTKNILHMIENASSQNFDIENDDIERINKIFERPIINIYPNRIFVSNEGQDNRLTYQTLEEAIDNKLCYVPSPTILSNSIKENNEIKPVKLIKTLDTTGKYDYDLVEGRVRYWAWVIANGNLPIPSYIRDEL